MNFSEISTCRCLPVWAAVLVSFLSGAAEAARTDGRLEISVVDSETGQAVPARIHLRDSRGRPVRSRGWGIAPLGDHAYVDGSAKLDLRRGQYEFDLDAGPEYLSQRGNFEIVRHAGDSKTIEVRRFVNLQKEGWYAGDLDVRRDAAELAIPMQAEQLAYLPTIAWERIDEMEWKPAIASRRTPGNDASDGLTSTRGPFAHFFTNPGNRLLLIRESAPFEPLTESTTVSSVDLISTERAEEDMHIIAVSPFERSFPIWLATGKLDAVLLLNRHSLRDGVVDNETDGRKRDVSMFPGKTGNGRWGEAIYYHALNAGLRLPPAAGSGSGANDNPIGANRVYVQCGQEFDAASWWHGLSAGNVVVTNGPLLRPSVEGQPPGYVFRIKDGQKIDLAVSLNLATRTPISYLEIVKNGVADQQVEIASLAKSKGKLPPVSFDDSGWFLVRAVTNRADKFEMASTGPYYVEKNGQPRISRRSVQFFLDWLDEEEPRTTPAERPAFAAAREFWQSRLAMANAE
ncbi:MAG: hypothetical protein WD851_09210 [Pirellulales bacterium]